MNIYVGNLAYSVTEDDLRQSFEQYGTVTTCDLIQDKYSGRSKGFGFVEMTNNQEAQSAIEALNETDLQGRPLKVNETRPKEERPERSSSDRY
ncbi:MAG: RNA-binding protein [Planctomycetes bacterium]|nr:RNA-binding protein [Planctomycetota bacterium]MCB9913131.1 RNA-binding protein [Planctomycetota bacterium]